MPPNVESGATADLLGGVIMNLCAHWSSWLTALDLPLAANLSDAVGEPVVAGRQVGERHLHVKGARNIFLEADDMNHQPRLARGGLKKSPDGRRHSGTATAHRWLAAREALDELRAGRRGAIAECKKADGRQRRFELGQNLPHETFHHVRFIDGGVDGRWMRGMMPPPQPAQQR